jgi:hypothetical protein
MSASKSADRRTPEAAELLDLLAELRLLRFLFGTVTASHDELREKVRVLAKAKHVVLFDGSEEPAPKVVTHCTRMGQFLVVIAEGLLVFEQLANSVVTKLSSVEVHRLWKQRTAQSAQQHGHPNRHKHAWLLSEDDAKDVDTQLKLQLARAAAAANA